MTINPNADSISINSISYPILSQIQPELVSVFPDKQVIGDFSKESDPIASTWAISDQRLGILLEELDAEKPEHKYRSWWSTANGKFRGNITLPPLATLATAPTASAPTIVDATMEAQSALWVGEDGFDGTHVHAGSLALYIHITNGTQEATQLLTGYVPGCEYTFTIYLYQTHDVGVTTSKLGVNDGVSATYGTATTDVDGEVLLTVTKTLSVSATKCQLLLNTNQAAVGDGDAWWDSATSAMTAITVGTSTCECNFNGHYYRSYGRVLAKLNESTGASFDTLVYMPATITTLVGPINSTMLIFLGDAGQYYYMSTAEAFVVTTTAGGLNANKGQIWDGKAFKVNTTGTMLYAVTPNSATPSWTAADGGYSLSNLPSGSLQALEIYRDANGNDIMYAGTKYGLYAYDFANTKWIHSEVKMPGHTTSGAGLAVWHSSLYISGGLHVIRYTSGDIADITSMGLDQDDGLPTTRSGEIVKLIEGYDELYALVDSTYEGTGSRSLVMSYNGYGWHCEWEATADNKHMYSGSTSSTYADRLWFSTTDGVYWIALYAGIRKPKKISAYPYATSAVHISPWLDMNWANGSKIALKLYIKTSDCVAANETVTMTYRIDHATTALASTWTTGTTISSNGVTTFTFGSSAGIAFKSIQFKFALAGRGGAYSPNIEWFALAYLKNLTTAWGYRMTIDCTKTYNHKSPSQLLDGLVTAASATTLIPIGFRNDESGTETYYGKVHSMAGQVQSGMRKEGQYNVFIVVP